MAKPLDPAIAKKFKEQRDKVQFECQVQKLITQCTSTLEKNEDGIKNLHIPPTEQVVWIEVLRHFTETGWNVTFIEDKCSIWID